MKNFLSHLSLCVGLIWILDSCTVQKHLSVYGGSRHDGMLTMYYEFTPLERPVVDWEHGEKLAHLKCVNWGYSGAESFGGGMTDCVHYSSEGDCARWRVYYNYQCID